MGSGAIKESENQSLRQIEHVRNKLRREIRTLEDKHALVKSELKDIHQNELRDLKEENTKLIIEESQKKEKILSSIKNNLQITKDLTDKHLKNIKEESDNRLEQIQTKNNADYEKAIQDKQHDLKVLDDKFKEENFKIHREGKKSISEMDNTLSDQYNERKNQLLTRITHQEREFIQRFNQQNKEHNELKQDLDKRNEKDILLTHKKQNETMSKLTNAHDKELKIKDENFRKGLKDQEVFYHDKYASNQKFYKAETDNLDNRYHKLVNNMKNSFAKELTKTEQRLSDSFYQLAELKPEWKRTENGVQVRVKIPEYSKQDIQLNINSKEVVLHFHRRYADQNESINGISNKVHKVESYTSRFDTGVILDPKKIKSSYENGEMIYEIAKA